MVHLNYVQLKFNIFNIYFTQGAADVPYLEVTLEYESGSGAQVLIFTVFKLFSMFNSFLISSFCLLYILGP